MSLTWEEEERIARLAPDESFRKMLRNTLESMAPAQRRKMLDDLERAAGGRPAPGRPNPGAHRGPSYCGRCGASLTGRYFSLKKPGGGNVDLCTRCMRLVRVRLRMLAARPNGKVRALVQSAIRDLQEAAALDPGSEQTRTNLKHIRPLLAAAGGSPLAFAFVWAPIWAVVRLVSSLRYVLISAVILAVAWGLYQRRGMWHIPDSLREKAWIWVIAAGLVIVGWNAIRKRGRRRRRRY